MTAQPPTGHPPERPDWRADLDPAEAERVERLDDALGLRLRDPELVHALVDPRGPLFQRLEWVGDSLLDAVTMRALLERQRWDNPDLGAVSDRRQQLVSDRALTRVARVSGLPPVGGFRASSQRLADRVEACIGAAWVDAGPVAAAAVARHLVTDPVLSEQQVRVTRPPGRGPADLARLEGALGHGFATPGWAAWAVEPGAQRRRLALLGDAVLEASSATALYEELPTADEGVLSERRRALDNNHRLAAAGARLGLRPLRQGSQGRGSRRRRRADIDRDVADSVQALVGAVAMDADVPTAIAAGRRVLGHPPHHGGPDHGPPAPAPRVGP